MGDLETQNTSARWEHNTETNDEFYTENIYLIPQPNKKSFRKLIKPTDFLSGSNINVTTEDGLTTKRTEGWQRLKVWSLGDLQYPGSTLSPDSSNPSGPDSMRWEPGAHAQGVGYNPPTSFILYGGVTLFHNQEWRWQYQIEDIPRIYCYVKIPYGYKVKKSYIFVGDMRKSPYTNGSINIDFDGMTMNTQIISVGTPNNSNPRYVNCTTETDVQVRDKHFVNNIINYENDSRLENNNFNSDKVLMLSLKYTGLDINSDIITENNGYKEVIYNSIFAVIKGGWVEFEKI